jgi:Cu(I)/Ag(I) efflux system membrane fusion protein
MMSTNRKTVIIAVLALLIGLMSGWLFFDGPKNIPVDQEKTGEVSGGTVWTCSMHPQIRRNGPARCPICGMDLITLEIDHDDNMDQGAVSLSPDALRLADVRTVVAGISNPVKSFRLNGKIDVDERRIFSQSSHITGRIEKLMVNFTGEFVHKGQVIAYIYSPELATAGEELLQAFKSKESFQRGEKKIIELETFRKSDKKHN